MHSTAINIELTKVDEKNTLVFHFSDDNLKINLESNDTIPIKNVFKKIAEQLCESDVEINYAIDESKIDKNKDGLFIEASQEYVECLKQEIDSLKEDENLKIIRSDIQVKKLA